MIFVLDTAIGLCIWIPFTIGKTTALLSVRIVKIIFYDGSSPPQFSWILIGHYKYFIFLSEPCVS